MVILNQLKKIYDTISELTTLVFSESTPSRVDDTGFANITLQLGDEYDTTVNIQAGPMGSMVQILFSIYDNNIKCDDLNIEDSVQNWDIVPSMTANRIVEGLKELCIRRIK